MTAAFTHNDTRFRTKFDGFRRAMPVWLCLQCHTHATVEKTKGMHCARCGSKGHHFPSQGEFKHYCFLAMLRDAGEISSLRLQTRFPLFMTHINGSPVIAATGDVKWATYIADFDYVDKSGKWVVTEFKGNRHHQDNASKLRREAATHVYNLSITVVEK